MTERDYNRFSDFYPFYLSEHRHPICRRLHFFGTLAILIALILLSMTGRWGGFFFLPILGYGPAWVGHFFFEKNRPATFRYPFYSLAGDFVMFRDILLKAIRWILGKIILLIEALFAPKGVQRSAEAQASVDQQTARLTLYQFKACPFCVKVRFAMKRWCLNIATRDAQNNPQYKKELIEQGGQYMVPCLRIEKEGGTAQWLYESDDIIRYLNERFAGSLPG